MNIAFLSVKMGILPSELEKESAYDISLLKTAIEAQAVYEEWEMKRREGVKKAQKSRRFVRG